MCSKHRVAMDRLHVFVVFVCSPFVLGLLLNGTMMRRLYAQVCIHEPHAAIVLPAARAVSHGFWRHDGADMRPPAAASMRGVGQDACTL